MADSPYATLTDVLRADAVVLDTLLTAHTVRHGGAGSCPAKGGCEARQVLRKTLDRFVEMLEREEASHSPAPQRSSVTTFKPTW